MSRPDIKAAKEAIWNAELERRSREYSEAVEDHPATHILRMLRLHTAEDNPLREAVEYLLERARDDDIGAP